MKLKHFKREPIETFAAAVNRFESLYIFWLQLDSPHTVDNIRLLSYEVVRQITQHLLSPRCAFQFSKSLGLLVGSPEQNINAHFANPLQPSRFTFSST